MKNQFVILILNTTKEFFTFRMMKRNWISQNNEYNELKSC